MQSLINGAVLYKQGESRTLKKAAETKFGPSPCVPSSEPALPIKRSQCRRVICFPGA